MVAGLLGLSEVLWVAKVQGSQLVVVALLELPSLELNPIQFLAVIDVA